MNVGTFIEERLRKKAKFKVVKDLDNLKELMLNNPISNELKTSKDVHYKVVHNIKSTFASNGIEEIMLKLEEKYYQEFSDEFVDNLNGYNDFLNTQEENE